MAKSFFPTNEFNKLMSSPAQAALRDIQNIQTILDNIATLQKQEVLDEEAIATLNAQVTLLIQEVQTLNTNVGPLNPPWTDGQLLIGNTAENAPDKNNLTAGPGITIVNGGGSILLSAAVAFGGAGFEPEDGVDGQPGPPGLNGGTGGTGPIGPAGPIGHGLDGQDADDIGVFMPGWSPGASFGTGPAGRLIGRRVITATGAYTYTPTIGTNSVIVELLGAGGGGGGVANPNTSTVNIGGGGNGGTWGSIRLTTGFNGATGSVGALGAGGTAGNNPGTAGGATTFVTTASVTYSVPGGAGAGQATNVTAPFFVNNNPGTNGSNSANFDVQKPPYGANEGIAVQAGVLFSGAGGSSVYGSGGFSADVNTGSTSAVGNNGTGNGAGGSGAVSNGGGTSRAGGSGTNGIVIIWEYS